MNLNEFTDKELEIIAEMLLDKISFRASRVDSFKSNGFRNKYQNEINTYELMRVKINNSLGKFK